MRLRIVATCPMTLFAGFAIVCGCFNTTKPASAPPSTVSVRTVKVSGTLVTLPEQDWSDEDAEWFYNVSQGSQLIPYDWIKALRTADDKQLFAESIPQFGYIARSSSSDNPEGLPVGFVKSQGSGREWLGLNCAACHTTVIEHEGKSYLIDGGPTLANVQAFLTSLSEALETTLNDAGRFDRFAKAVLGVNAPEQDREDLRQDLTVMAATRKGYIDRNLPKKGATEFGFGRVDAVGAILNEVTEKFLAEPANHHDADAPVSYPFLWDTPFHDRVEWNGSAPNSAFDLGNLARNVGEVLGVFGDLEIPEDAPVAGYRSSVEFKGLRQIEAKLKKLKSPLWPTGITRPTGHKAMADQGKKHFDRLCAACHKFTTGDRDDPNRTIIAKMDDVGTDPAMAANFREREVATGRLEGTKINFNPIGGNFEAKAAGATVLVHTIIGTIVGGWKEAPPDQLERLKQRPPGLKSVEKENKYKGRPLNGIWATGPYLHNGSVPTLRDLLRPATERPKTFWVGSRRFNPQDVGFESTEQPGTSKFDTRLPGNLNTGHEYGTGVSKDAGGDGETLKPDEIEELLEYLKSL